ncbi:MAG: DUF4302 domain-containing protein [Muribaculaceae bacterium]|nr:DUF4302 domain-containing protein [Muribaculaceae bacterium]
MKKFLNISLLSLVALSALTLGSCKNEVDEIFDDDAVARLEKAQKEYYDILTDKGGKWQLEYYANSNEPGYIYLMTFKKDGSVTIAGKNEWIGYEMGQSLKVPTYASETSLWEVITDNGPVLSFNSYNRTFHIFASPEDLFSTDTEAPDETGYGHEGDYEFDLMKYSGDTLYVTGKKYGIDMIMTRVDANVDDEVYMNEVDSMKTLFFNARIPQVFINLPNGIRWIVKDGASSILKMFREGDDEISTSEYHNVIITHDGLSFMYPVTLDGYVIKNFIRQADGSLLCRDDNETTMTADELSTVFAIKTFTWKADTTQFGGTFKQELQQIRNELSAYGGRSLVGLQISYDAKTNQTYKVTFSCKSGKNTFNPSFYVNIEAINGNQMKFNYTGLKDAAGETYSKEENCPSMIDFVELLGNTLNLTTSSLLAPVDMRLTDSGNSANYSYWAL